jgi:Arc/MetJ family transcription regulator
MCIKLLNFVYDKLTMRTNIVLNDRLIKEAMRLSHAHSKKQTVELALENFVAFLKRKSMKNLFGKVKWEGDLKHMRGI